MYPYKKSFDHVLTFEKNGTVATLTLDCPQNLNRVTEQLVDELGGALDRARWDHEIRAVVLRGNGEVSFGPGDLAVIKTKLAKNLTEAREIMQEIGEVIKKMYALPKPIIGLAEGGCLGGGCNILLSCDIVIASEKASFHELFANFALTPDSGGLWSLQRLVGPMKAKALCMLAEPITAADALAMGMVYKVVPADRARQQAEQLASAIAAKSPVGINHIKQISNRLHDYSMDTYFQLEADYISLGALSEDFKETTAAMAEKRLPRYQGF